MAGGTKGAARTVRRVTRKAVKRGMPVKPSNKGLGITKNEGSAKLQKSVKKLGYNRSEKIVQRTKARVQARQAARQTGIGSSIRAKGGKPREGAPKHPGRVPTFGGSLKATGGSKKGSLPVGKSGGRSGGPAVKKPGVKGVIKPKPMGYRPTR